MGPVEREKWNDRYARRVVAPELDPAPWLVENLRLARQGRALDLASGLGDQALYLAYQGWQVEAIDISEVGPGRARQRERRAGLRVAWIVADLTTFVLPSDRYDLITCFYYLQREGLAEQIGRALRPGGILIFETFTHDQLAMPNSQIKNPEHTLRPGELLRLFPGLRVRRYRDELVDGRAVAGLVAEKPVLLT